MRFATIGDIAVDVLASAGEALTRGADARGSVRFVPGGSAANVAVWAARLGASVSCIGATGADPWGAWLRDASANLGVLLDRDALANLGSAELDDIARKRITDIALRRRRRKSSNQ